MKTTKDPHERKNLIETPELAALIKKHRAFVPKTAHPILGNRSTGHAAFAASKENIKIVILTFCQKEIDTAYAFCTIVSR